MTGDPWTTEITVYGVPKPQGSKRIGRHGNRPVILDNNDAELGPWRAAVVVATRRRMGTSPPLDGPLSLLVVFTLPRPASAPKSRKYPDRRPDLDKLLRAVFDGLTDGGAWRDDAQVVTVTTTKRYVGDELALVVPGAEIGIDSL